MGHNDQKRAAHMELNDCHIRSSYVQFLKFVDKVERIHMCYHHRPISAVSRNLCDFIVRLVDWDRDIQ